MMQPQHIHLIGIGGAGLSAIATVLLEQGYTVSGSDLQASPTTERLARLGVAVHIGHAAANLGEADLVVVSSAVPAGNPEVVEAGRRGVPVVKRAEWLGHMMAHQQGVAIAGTHGKTTTTAMIAFILHKAGLDPTFIVGGGLPQLGTNAAAGVSDIFVIEADEYDHTFLGLRPEIAVVTIVEWDHPDCYPTPESMLDAFRQFIALVPPEGLLVACGDEPTVGELLGNWKTGRLEDWKDDSLLKDAQPSNLPTFQPSNLPALTTYGLNDDNDWHAFDLRPNTRGGYDFSIATNLPISQFPNLPISQSTNLPTFQPSNLPVRHASTSVPGIHNVKNTLAALIVADRLGVPFEQATAILAKFTGVERRFEIKGEAGEVLVVDDYAHHPTEIRATLEGARTHYPDREIWAVFQPHTYSRTRSFLDEFAAAFADADHVVVVDIFPAREVDDGSVNSRDLVTRMRHPDARYIGTLDDASNFLSGQLRPGDLLITLGAGDGYRVGEMVIRELGSRKLASRKVTAQADSENGIDELADDLSSRFGQRLRRDEALADHTTLRVGGPADLWLTASTLDELIEATTLAWEHRVPVYLLGSGANMLVSDRGIRGLVIQNRCQQVTLPHAEDELSDPPHVVVESGVILPSLAHRLAHQGLSGLEWAVGVPGTIGGAVVNNAGAHGSSMADCLVRAELQSPANRLREWHLVNWFEYEYRSSRLKRLSMAQARENGEQFVVLQAELALSRKSPAEIENRMAAYNARRRETQPPGASIGSMFKNPPGDYAGRLIEAAGLKGTQIGGAQISPVHANFFVNHGKAKAADFAILIDLARKTVKARFDIELELEIERIGDWGNG